MSKLLLSLLLSGSFVAVNATEMAARDVIDSLESQNPTTSTNPNPYVTGNIAYSNSAQISFNIDPVSPLGEKVMSLIIFCSEVAEKSASSDETVMTELVERFGTLTAKEQQFVQTLLACTTALRTATEELANEVSPVEEAAQQD